MLVINQRLDKLAAMWSDFAARAMLPTGHAPQAIDGGQTSNGLGPLHSKSDRSRHGADEGDDDSDNEGPVDSDSDAHVVLARRSRMYLCLTS